MTDEAIPQTQNEIDNALIKEWEEAPAEAAEAVTTIEGPTGNDAPTVFDPEAIPNPEPISAEQVAGDKPTEVVAPDATALRDQLAALHPPKEETAAPDNRDAEIAQLREAVTRLSQGKVADPIAFLKQATGLSPEDLVLKQQEAANPAAAAQEAAQAALDQNAALRAELAEERRNSQLQAVAKGLEVFIEANKVTYPSMEGGANLVLEAMSSPQEDGTYFSETQAAAHVESTLNAFVIEGAKALGLISMDSEGKAVTSGTSDSQTLNPATAGSTPSSKSWDEMSFEERDQELIKQL